MGFFDDFVDNITNVKSPLNATTLGRNINSALGIFDDFLPQQPDYSGIVSAQRKQQEEELRRRAMETNRKDLQASNLAARAFSQDSGNLLDDLLG